MTKFNADKFAEAMDTRSGDEVAIDELVRALVTTVDYVGVQTLPAIDGWSWYDTLLKYSPQDAALFQARYERERHKTPPICFHVTAEDNELATMEIISIALRNLDDDTRGRVIRWAASKFEGES